MNWVVQILAALGGLGFVGTAINAIAQRRKIRAESSRTGADAAAVLMQAATKYADEVRSDAREDTAALRRDLIDTRAELISTRAELVAMHRHLATLEGLLRRHLPDLPVPEWLWPPAESGGRS